MLLIALWVMKFEMFTLNNLGDQMSGCLSCLKSVTFLFKSVSLVEAQIAGMPVQSNSPSVPLCVCLSPVLSVLLVLFWLSLQQHVASPPCDEPALQTHRPLKGRAFTPICNQRLKRTEQPASTLKDTVP